jgi:hypothetical protein
LGFSIICEAAAFFDVCFEAKVVKILVASKKNKTVSSEKLSFCSLLCISRTLYQARSQVGAANCKRHDQQGPALLVSDKERTLRVVMGKGHVVLSRAYQIVGGRALGPDNVGIIIESISEISSGMPVPDGYASSMARSDSLTVSNWFCFGLAEKVPGELEVGLHAAFLLQVPTLTDC